MLYSDSNMNQKLPVPDELIMFDRQFSWRTAWKVGRWLIAAFLLSALADVIFGQRVSRWPIEWRMAILGAEFLGIAIGIRSVRQWIGGMDELHRRFTLSILFFAVSATFLFLLLWLRLERMGFFHAVFGPPFSNNSWGIYSVAHVVLLFGGFYGLGYLILTRRYR